MLSLAMLLPPPFFASGGSLLGAALSRGARRCICKAATTCNDRGESELHGGHTGWRRRASRVVAAAVRVIQRDQGRAREARHFLSGFDADLQMPVRPVDRVRHAGGGAHPSISLGIW